MAITFKEDWTSGAGKFISVLRDGQAFGRIFHTAGVYQFYEGEQATLATVSCVKGSLVERGGATWCLS